MEKILDLKEDCIMIPMKMHAPTTKPLRIQRALLAERSAGEQLWPFYFDCPNCLRLLRYSGVSATLAGPCPSCGVWVQSPVAILEDGSHSGAS